MTTTIEALQNLYVAEGGELSDVANLVTIPDMINALAALKIANKAAETSTDNQGGNSND